MSAKVKHTMDEVILNVTSVPHRFSPSRIARNWHELEERLLSILLGYDYPYLAAERPRRQRHLGLDVVIPFVHRFRHRLVSEELLAPGGEIVVLGTTEENDIVHSCLYQAVQSLCSSGHGKLSDQETEQMTEQIVAELCSCRVVESPDQVTEFQVQQKIAEQMKERTLARIDLWHRLWEMGSTSDLNAELINFLLPFRYQKSQRALRIQQYEQWCKDWQGVMKQLDSLRQLHTEHGKELIATGPLSAQARTWTPKPQIC